MSFLVDTILFDVQGDILGEQDRAAESARRLEAIRAGCTKKQRQVLDDTSDYISVLCPRRSGKSFSVSALAVYICEKYPGTRVLIISLSLKHAKENYWTHGTSGIFTMDRRFGLGLSYNSTSCVWQHQNGSRGLLAGADTAADLEYLRGAAAEADIAIVDEAASFAPALLAKLIDDVLDPGLMSRAGRLVLAGTPGFIPMGPFFESSYLPNRVSIPHPEDEDLPPVEVPSCILYEDKQGMADYRAQQAEYVIKAKAARLAAGGIWTEEDEVLDSPWSLHHWTIKDNTALPHQWARALLKKKRAKWDDNHPTWLREYLGMWVFSDSAYVYSFLRLRSTGKVTWVPNPTPDNPTGLPQDQGPWHLVMGMDWGFKDDFSVVLAAYSEKLAELRHVADYSCPELTIDAIGAAIQEMIDQYGMPEAMVADYAGKTIIASLNAQYGWNIVNAQKSEKVDHMILLDGDFVAGRAKVVLDSGLDHELSTLVWDFSREADKRKLAAAGKLKESPACPNHRTDSFLYLWRFSYHNFARPDAPKEVQDSEQKMVAALTAYETRMASKKTTRRKRQYGINPSKVAHA